MALWLAMLSTGIFIHLNVLNINADLFIPENMHCFVSFTNHFESSKWTFLDPRVISHDFYTNYFLFGLHFILQMLLFTNHFESSSKWPSLGPRVISHALYTNCFLFG